MRNACKGALTLFTGQRGREKKERERKREKEEKRGRERGEERETNGEKGREIKREMIGRRYMREREREREGEIEIDRCRICPELFLFLKGMTSALAPFSYLVLIKSEKWINAVSLFFDDEGR